MGKNLFSTTLKKTGLNETRVGTIYSGAVCSIISKPLLDVYDPINA